MPERNGTWKWIAGILIAALFSITGYLYTTTQAKIVEGDRVLLEAVKEIKMQGNLHDSAIARLNSQDAVKTQWEIMMSKKVDLLLKHARIPEYMWPSIEPDTTGN